MRIIVHDYAGHPFQVQLSRELACRGHQVLHLFYAYNNTPKGNLLKADKDPANLRIEGVLTKEPIQKYSYLKRWSQETEYGRLVAKYIRSSMPDVLVSANTPLDSLRYIFSACQQSGVRFVFWLQDVSGLAAYELLRRKIPIAGSWIGKYYIRLERSILRQSGSVVLISDDFKPIVENWGVSPEKTKVIPNWAVLEEVHPQPKNNPWSQEFSLADGFVFLYAGTLGLKHNPALLLDLALHFRQRPAIQVVVISEGPGADWLKEQKALHKLENLRLLPYQPYHQLQYVLAAADVLVAILEPEAGVFSVPSKVLTYLCAQRPLLLALPPENQAARLVARSAAGLIVPPGDLHAWRAAAERLIQNPSLRHELACNARIYAETHFDIHKIADQFEAVLRPQ